VICVHCLGRAAHKQFWFQVDWFKHLDLRISEGSVLCHLVELETVMRKFPGIDNEGRVNLLSETFCSVLHPCDPQVLLITGLCVCICVCAQCHNPCKHSTDIHGYYKCKW